MTEEIKVRVPKDAKQELERLAGGRHLGVSDIVREALREYFQRGKKGKAAV